MQITLRRGRLLVGFLLATIVCAVVISRFDAPLHTAEAPAGIVSFELAWSIERANAILESWDTAARLSASFLQGLDYLFLCLYSVTLALGCLYARDRFQARGWRLASGGSVIAALSLLAGFSDAIENAPLAMILFAGEAHAPLPQIAAVAAAIKFLFVLVGLLYASAGLFARPRPS